MQPNARLCRHKTMAVACGVATVKPDETFSVKICNFGPDTFIVRKGYTVAFAEPRLGQVLLAPVEERAPPSAAAVEETRNALEDIDLHDSPDYLHQQSRTCWLSTAITTLPNGSVQTGDHCRSDQQNVQAQGHETKSQRLGKPRRHSAKKEWEGPLLRRLPTAEQHNQKGCLPTLSHGGLPRLTR
eukprot:contig_7732_g1817